MTNQGLLQQLKKLVSTTDYKHRKLSRLEQKFKMKEPQPKSVQNHSWKTAHWVDMLEDGTYSYSSVCFH